MRIVKSDLEAVCKRINRTVNRSDETPQRVGSDASPNVYWISGAYGGHSLYRTGSDGRGAEDVFRRGHVSKRELYDLMQAFLTGYETASDHR